MWRPETKGEKAARENPPPVHIQPVVQAPTVHTRNMDLGCFDECLKVVEYAAYVIFCCGCCTSYTEYHGGINFDDPGA